MGDRIKGMRQHLGAVVFGVLDGDFGELAQPVPGPTDWMVEGQFFGWRWKRKEIENYILDPVVVDRALGATTPPPAAYLPMLEAAREQIAAYEAARTCLGLMQKAYRPMPTSFGRPRGSDNHQFPDTLDEPSCRSELERTLAQYEGGLTAGRHHFDRLLGECGLGGSRFAEFLTYFAGKDLLWAINAPLQQLGYAGCGAFRERVLLGIEATFDAVQTWLPEWGALRDAVLNA